MNQFELAKKEKEQDKRYKQLLQAVQSNDIKVLQRYFPRPHDFIEFNHNRRNREEHVLEAMTRYSSPEFIKKVFDTYFTGDDTEVMELKDKFLRESSSTGVRLNYRYFAPYLPQELTDKVADSYGVDKPLKRKDEKQDDIENEPQKTFISKVKGLFGRKEKAPKDTRPRMEQIYDIIKEENRSLNEYRNKDIRRRHLDLRETDEKPVEHFYTAKDKSKALQFEADAMPSIFVRRANAIDENDESYKKDELIRIDVADNLGGRKTKTDLVQSLYDNADFPEDYMWAIKSLKRFGKEYEEVIKTDAVNLAQVKEFAKDGGRFFIEQSKTNDHCNTEDYIACAGKKEGYSVIRINCEAYERKESADNSVLHELIHRADLNSSKAFSDTDFFKKMAVLMVAENEDEWVAQMARHISNSYKPGNIYCELLAYMNEGGKEKLKYSELAMNVRDIYGIYTEAKIHGDTKTMEMIASYNPYPENRIVQDTFGLSNGGVILDKEKLQLNVPIALENIKNLKKEIQARQKLDEIGLEIPSYLKNNKSNFPRYSTYLQAVEEYNGVKNKEQGLDNLGKWVENISKSDNEEEFLKATTMAYFYTTCYRKSEQDIFETNNIPNISPSYKDKIARMFKEEAIHLRALDIASCSKDEALLAEDAKIPIKELLNYKKIGKAMVEALGKESDITEKLAAMADQANESGDDKDYLKVLGAVEYVGQKKGIENPLGYDIQTKAMLNAVTTLTENFIAAHFKKEEHVSAKGAKNPQSYQVFEKQRNDWQKV